MTAHCDAPMDAPAYSWQNLNMPWNTGQSSVRLYRRTLFWFSGACGRQAAAVLTAQQSNNLQACPPRSDN